MNGPDLSRETETTKFNSLACIHHVSAPPLLLQMWIKPPRQAFWPMSSVSLGQRRGRGRCTAGQDQEIGNRQRINNKFFLNKKKGGGRRRRRRRRRRSESSRKAEWLIIRGLGGSETQSASMAATMRREGVITIVSYRPCGLALHGTVE
jgi:hypothetical protein